MIDSDAFLDGEVTTCTLDSFEVLANEVKVIDGGLFTTVQDLPGRLGYWDVGVPPSGPMDDRSHRLVTALSATTLARRRWR